MKAILLILAVCVLAACAQCPHSSKLSSKSPSKRLEKRSPVKVVTTTVTTFGDDDDEDDRSSLACRGDGKINYGSELVSVREVSIIQSTWETLKKDGDFAPKIFLRYIKAVPETQKLFPAFANVPVSELSTNSDFLLQAYTCISALNAPIKHLGTCPKSCPIYSAVNSRYPALDVKKLNGIWMTTVQEELGTSFNNEVRTAWENGLKAVANFISKTTVY